MPAFSSSRWKLAGCTAVKALRPQDVELVEDGACGIDISTFEATVTPLGTAL
ncbi:hypothetical protein [Kitasatospora phosalacinea]|uniref:Uncharacterized protein n=1 Tax=Kitasatospora phosalacinea TaxID=2065 RepID=A0ABW6GLK4_9ACTN